MKILFALLMSYNTFATYYMGKDFTLKELKDGFKAQYIDKHPTASLDSMDVVYFSSKNAYKINANETNNFICANPALHQAGDIVLPKSKFVILEEKEEDTGWIKYSVYWIEPRQEPDLKTNQKLRNTLRKKYGSLEVNDTTVLIPAKWFSGEIMWISKPYLYGNQYVSSFRRYERVKDGSYYRNDEDLKAQTAEWDVPYSDFGATVRGLDSLVGNGRRIMPPPTSEELLEEKQIALLKTAINSYLDKKFLPFEYKSREFNVMLRRDETLKSHLYYLEDEDSLSTEDRLALTCISMAIEQLPAGIFHPLWCDRGLYPAIFLKVRLDDFGCRVSLYEE